MNRFDKFDLFRRELTNASRDKPFLVFLCGPNFSEDSAAARLRSTIKARLESENFEVVLGEDDGLDNPQLDNLGINAQDGELAFISSHCNAIVIVAGSIGSFCELGLFSWHYSHPQGEIDPGETDCFVLIEEKYKAARSYLNRGPATAVRSIGKVEFVDFAIYDCESLVERLRDRRGITTVDNRRGRPRKRSR